jgi:hypothetical protein
MIFWHTVVLPDAVPPAIPVDQQPQAMAEQRKGEGSGDMACMHVSSPDWTPSEQ